LWLFLDLVVNDCITKRLGIGVITRESKGFVIAAMSRSVNTIQEPVTAEAMGALSAVELCKEIGIQEIFLEGDSKTVVQAIQGMGSNLCLYGQIVGDIQMVLKQCRKWEVGHVGREGNQAAHILAKAAVQEFRETIWLEEIPSIIQNVVLL
jgi:ribonuclease HI